MKRAYKRVSRKRFMRCLMSRGIQRNGAQIIADKVIQQKTSYAIALWALLPIAPLLAIMSIIGDFEMIQIQTRKPTIKGDSDA